MSRFHNLMLNLYHIFAYTLFLNNKFQDCWIKPVQNIEMESRISGFLRPVA
ncbi:hypothetical protein THOG05_90064 [Vibrio rotiferianus]|nr:hypothetical protein THOG05_90064 [Vibrio rotiferianus]CAH1592456.1 hypothetical protein THOG10_60097 [Vibrio rotiferianus]CAH1593341.1 hypothetical protein THOB06_60097 [Vibrio rotiferianus]